MTDTKLNARVFRGSKVLGKHAYYIGLNTDGDPEAGVWLTAQGALRLIDRLEKMVARLEKKNGK